MEERISNILEKISINSHSSIRIDNHGTIVYVDPFEMKEAKNDGDLILFTHDHFDHFSPEDVAKAAGDKAIFAAPLSSGKTVMNAGVPKNSLVLLNPGDKVKLCGQDIEAVWSYNPAKKFHPKENKWLGYLLTVDGVKIYITGDMDENEEALAIDCDILMLPVGATFTFDPKEAAEFAKKMMPKVVIPTHYGTAVGTKVDGDDFIAALGGKLEAVKKLPW